MRNKSLSIGVLIWISLIWISLSAAQGETWPPPICSERSKDNPEPRTRLAVLYQQELEESYLNPDFHFSFGSANHRVASDAFIYVGLRALKALRRSTPNG